MLAGTVDTFDREGFKRTLLKVFTNALDVTLIVTAASVKVVTQIDFADPTAAAAATSTINTTPVAKMQTEWFAANGLVVTIENTPSATSEAVTIDPTKVANKAALESAGIVVEDTAGRTAGAVVGSLFGVGFLAYAAYFVFKRKKLSKLYVAGMPSKGRGKTSRTGHKSRVLPEVAVVGADGAGEATGTAPLIGGDSCSRSSTDAPLAVAESGTAAAAPVVKGQRSPSLFAGRKNREIAPLAVPLATATDQGWRVPPLSPQHRAEAEADEKKKKNAENSLLSPAAEEGKDDVADEQSDTSAGESASTALVTGGMPPSAPPATRFEMMDEQMAMAGSTDPAMAAMMTPAALPSQLPPISAMPSAPLPPIASEVDPANKK